MGRNVFVRIIGVHVSTVNYSGQVKFRWPCNMSLLRMTFGSVFDKNVGLLTSVPLSANGPSLSKCLEGKQRGEIIPDLMVYHVLICLMYSL